MNDRCDNCGAQAYVQVLFESGELLFCAHHWNKYETVATDKAARILDERHRLEPKKIVPVEEESEKPVRRQD